MELLAPFLQGTSTPYNMPVYPGAQRIIADALIVGRSSAKRGPLVQAGSASRLDLWRYAPRVFVKTE